ncbi:MAG: hypothetical protein FVQ79_03455 [Planctomycetes bacterium]|nr:hypothetical protein [Planctomycetota bacterium]
MSDNDINDVNCGSDCGSCGGEDNVNNSGGGDGDDSPCCDSGNSHKQADLKMLVFVLVLILAGAVAAHSIFNKDKNAGACGPGGCPSGSEQVEGSLSSDSADTLSGSCPISGKSSAGGDDVKKVFNGEKAASPCCPGSGTK